MFSTSIIANFLVVNTRSLRPIRALDVLSCHLWIRKAAEPTERVSSHKFSPSSSLFPLTTRRIMHLSGYQYAEGTASIHSQLDKYNESNEEQLLAMIRGRAGVFVWRTSLGKYAYEHRHSRGKISGLRNSLYKHSSGLIGMLQNEEDCVSSTFPPGGTQTADTLFSCQVIEVTIIGWKPTNSPEQRDHFMKAVFESG